MPRTVKQYWRRILIQFGMFDEAAYKLVIDRIDPNDIFIVSYPKSGNTWMRFLVANILEPSMAWTFRNIGSLIPDIYADNGTINHIQRPAYIKAHHPWFNYYPKSIYIVRDYRDVLLSYYAYQVAMKAWAGNFSSFIREHEKLDEFGSWSQHVLEALQFQKEHPQRILIVKYEELHTNTKSELKKVVEFCRISKNTKLEDVIEKSNFSALKNAEEVHGSTFKDLTESTFFRKGETGNWRTEISSEDIAYIEEHNTSALLAFGYPLATQK